MTMARIQDAASTSRTSLADFLADPAGWALIYTRISNDDKKKTEQGREGVESQAFRAHEALDNRDWPKDRRILFTDNDITASEFGRKEREDYQLMLRYIAAGKDCLVIATEQQRIVRQLSEGEAFAKLMIRMGHRLNMLSMGEVDLTSDAGDYLWYQMLLQGRNESKGISRRQRTKNAASRAQGIMKTHRPAFGYTDGTYGTHDVAQAAMFRELVKDVIDGANTRDCARKLAAKGFVSPYTGKPYGRVAIRSMLMNPVYAGFLVHKGEIRGTAKNVLPILTIPEHEDVVRTLQNRTDAYKERAKPNALTNSRRHVLTGLVRCGKCATPMRIQSSDGKRVWGCPSTKEGGCGGTKRSYDLVQRVADAAIRELLANARVRAVERSETDPARVKLWGEVAKLQTRLDDLLESMAEPGFEMPPQDAYRLAGFLRDGISTRRATLASMVRAAERSLPPDALAIWDDESLDSLPARRALAAMLLESVVVLPCGPVSPKGAPPESVQVYPVEDQGGNRGNAPAIADIAGVRKAS